jgi:hypothetical protein
MLIHISYVSWLAPARHVTSGQSHTTTVKDLIAKLGGLLEHHKQAKQNVDLIEPTAKRGQTKGRKMRAR